MKITLQIINLVLLTSILLMPSALADELANESAYNTSSANSSVENMANNIVPNSADCLQSQNKYLNYFWKAECKTEEFTDEKGLDKYYFKVIFVIIAAIILWLIAKSVF